jgi:hypothetical protein
MIKPTKHEKLSRSLLALGADVLFLLKGRNWSVEELFHVLRKEKNIDIDSFYECLTFLFLAGILEYENYQIGGKSN